MAKKCSIIRNPDDNKIVSVLDLENNESKLYNDLKNKVEDDEYALDLYMLAYTDEFRRYKGQKDWVNEPNPIEPSVDEVLNFDKHNSHLRKEYNFNTGRDYELSKLEEYIDRTIKDLEIKINLFPGKKGYRKKIEERLDLVKLRQNIKDYNKADTLKAILATVQYNVKELDLISKKVEHTKNIRFNELSGNDLVKAEKELVNTLYNSQLFLQGYARVEDLDLNEFNEESTNDLRKEIEKILTDEKIDYAAVSRKVNEVLDESIGNDIDKKIKLLINIMKSYEPKINDIENKINGLYDDHITRIVETTTTNPELKKDIKKFLAEQFDETLQQLWLDALSDTHVPLVANVMKLYNRMEYNKEEELKQETRLFDDKYKKLLKQVGDNTKRIDKIFKSIEGRKLGQLTPKYSDSYYDEVYKYLDNIETSKITYGENSREAIRAQEEFNRWSLDNQIQQYDQRWIDAQKLLSIDARIERKLVRNKINRLLELYKKESKYKGFEDKTYYDLTELSDDKKDDLYLLNAEYKKLGQEKEWIDGKIVDKKGKELEIAKSIQTYNEKLKELNMFEKKVVPEFRKIYEELKKDGNATKLTEFELLNTFTEVTQDFYNERGKYPDIAYPDNIKKLQDELSLLTTPYKSDTGTIIHLIPKDILTRVNDIEEVLEKFFASDEGKALLKGRGVARKLKMIKIPTNYLRYREFKEYEVEKLNNKEHPLYSRFIPESIEGEGKVFRKHHAPTSNFTISNIKDEFIVKDKEGNPIVIKDKSGYGIPTENYYSTQYKELLNDKEVLEFYEYLTDLLTRMVDHYEGSIIDKGYLPAVSNTDVGRWKAIMQAFGWYDRPEKTTVSVDLKDNIIKNIPLNFVRYLGEFKPLYRIPKFNPILDTYLDYEERILKDFKLKFPEVEANSIEDIKSYNKQAKLDNEKSHGSSISYDLKEVIPLFIKSAVNNKYKSEMKSELMMTREKIARDRFINVNGRGTPFKIFERGKNEDEYATYTTEGKSSNILKHYDMWTDMIYYENFERDTGVWTKIARVLQNYTSLKGIALNPTSGINNVVYGKIMMATEAAGGYFFGNKEWRQAMKDYATNLVPMIADLKKNGKYSSVESAIVKELNIMENQDEKAESAGIATNFNIAHKILMVTNTVYILQHLGEHNMQNQILFAMMYSHRVVHGKIMSFNDYKRGYLEEIKNENGKYKTEENKKRIERNREKLKSLEVEFNKFPTVKESYKLNENKELEFTETLNENELADFKQKIISVNQKIHGIYNKKDAGTVQQFALGRLAIQFRKWAPEATNRRFYGLRHFKTKGRFDWNERRGEQKEGMYISATRLLTRPYKELRQENNVFMSAVKTMIEDMKMFAYKNNVYWNSMTETQQANVRRTFIEFGALFTFMGLLALVRGMGRDDEELKKNIVYNIILYQLDRTVTELKTFTPYGVINEGRKLFKSPAPTMNSIEQIIKLGGVILKYPFWDEDERKYRGGRYHGQDKLTVELKNVTPTVTHVQRLSPLNLRRQLQYFKLY